MKTGFYFPAISIGLSNITKNVSGMELILTHYFLNINLVRILLFTGCFKLNFWEHIQPFVTWFK